MDLITAIAAVETAQTNVNNADSASTAAQAKFDAAQAALTSSTQGDADALMAFNKSLDDLIASATAAKR